MFASSEPLDLQGVQSFLFLFKIKANKHSQKNDQCVMGMFQKRSPAGERGMAQTKKVGYNGGATLKRVVSGGKKGAG